MDNITIELEYTATNGKRYEIAATNPVSKNNSKLAIVLPIDCCDNARVLVLQMNKFAH